MSLLAAILLSAALSANSADFPAYTYHLKVVKPSVVEHGTAVAVQAEGYGHFILTANHCVKDVTVAELSNGDKTFKATVVYRDAEMDFAILKGDAKEYASLTEANMAKGTSLTFCHYPRAVGPKVSDARVVDVKDGNIDYFAHADGFYHGSSGCPVFLKKDVVVGIAISGLGIDGKMIEGEAVFLPAKRIFQSMKHYVESKKTPDKDANAEVIDLEEKF